MGYDQHHPEKFPHSSDTTCRSSRFPNFLVAIAVAVLPVVGLGIIALIGVGVAIWRDFGGVPQVAVVEQQAAVELHDLEDIELDRMVPLQRQDASFADSSDPRLNFEVEIDGEGNATIEGDAIGLDELRARLAKLKDETSNAFSVRINADPECPAKHIIPVLDVCEEVGDIDYRVVFSSDSKMPSDGITLHSDN